METKTLFLICLFILAIAMICTFRTKENLLYLKQYENQDQWRNNPTSWPIAQIPAMANYEIERNENLI